VAQKLGPIVGWLQGSNACQQRVLAVLVGHCFTRGSRRIKIFLKLPKQLPISAFTAYKNPTLPIIAVTDQFGVTTRSSHPQKAVFTKHIQRQEGVSGFSVA
jgi:hypothetical protein